MLKLETYGDGGYPNAGVFVGDMCGVVGDGLIGDIVVLFARLPVREAGLGLSIGFSSFGLLAIARSSIIAQRILTTESKRAEYIFWITFHCHAITGVLVTRQDG